MAKRNKVSFEEMKKANEEAELKRQAIAKLTPEELAALTKR